ncbi:ABC transporter permease [Microvirga sp. TS319]|uniref:ABC transporter permease n=1 Tax=Microvirga sp. TS319 TaxID=3241165 RepID=UPI00351A008F
MTNASLLQVQFRVVGALVLREMRTRFGRSRAGYLWALVQPIGHISILTVVLASMQRAVPVGPSIQLFLATGLIPYLLFMNLVTRLMTAIVSNQTLFTFPIVKILDAVAARALLEILTICLIGMLVLAGLALLGLGLIPEEPANLAGALAATALYGIGFGLTSMAIYSVFPAWDRIQALLLLPLYFCTGIFYVPDTLPVAFRDVIVWNPLLHGVEWFRSGFYANYGAATLDKGYFIGWGVSLLLVGLVLERVVCRGRATQ